MIDKIKKALARFGVKSNLFLHQRSNNDWGLLWTTGSQQYL